jgi:glucan-binding YG repeat protein
VKNGWLWEQKKKAWVWRCYENGNPRTGWYEENGLRYYLQEDGTVTTGKAKIDGKNYVFTDRGVMHTGWLRNGSYMRYYGQEGVFLTGWQDIENSKYFFNSKGYRITSGGRKDGDVRYKFLSDGRATPIK